MAEKKTVAAECSKRKGQKTRAELLEENKKLKENVKHLTENCSYLDVQRRDYAEQLQNANKTVESVCLARDALQRRCDYLEKSRQAWVMKCDALTGQLYDVSEERERLKELAEDYLKSFYEENHLRNDLLVHPWKNLWNHIKAVLGVG